jgi:alpha-D-xyloside xylohydrolase
VDISEDFRSFEHTYYLADSLSGFNPQTAEGQLTYTRHEYSTRMAFNNMLGVLQSVDQNEFPALEYEASPTLPFSIEFISPRTVRIRAKTGRGGKTEEESLMLIDGNDAEGERWDYQKTDRGYKYTSDYGSVTITKNPWHVEFRDANGKLLTSTMHRSDFQNTFTPVLPFSYVRRASDYSKSINAAFSLSPGEKIYGCGESFTEFNKRGSEVVLFADDANGTQNESMYKPIPFFMSSRGYGMFMHTSTPITCDFGKYYNGTNSLMIGDSELDLFVFLGNPKQILDEYTELTGKAAMPPLWSFGFWMSRITYF